MIDKAEVTKVELFPDEQIARTKRVAKLVFVDGNLTEEQKPDESFGDFAERIAQKVSSSEGHLSLAYVAVQITMEDPVAAALINGKIQPSVQPLAPVTPGNS